MDRKNKYFKAAAFTPKIRIADPMANVEEIMDIFVKNHDAADIFVFPELCITGYTCADLFHQSVLIDGTLKALIMLRDFLSSYKNKLVVVGAPLRKDNQLFNCAVYLCNGRILGVVPKVYVPNYNEFYEKRWFASGAARLDDVITIGGEKVPFSVELLFRNEEMGVCIGTDICEDLWMPVPPSSKHVLYGANLIVNLSASNELISKSAYRRDLVKMQSAKCICGYVYASAGVDESTTDVVFSGHKLIAANGEIICENRYDENPVSAVIDLEKLINDRTRFNTFMGNVDEKKYMFVDIPFCDIEDENCFSDMSVDPYPFVPKDVKKRRERCVEIFDIQSYGLSQRMKKTGIKKLVIGISGGLDSTLALLVSVEAMKKLALPMENVIGITMPGYGTSGRTLENAKNLMKYLGITSREVSIVPACEQHFADIGHDKSVLDVTYENVQARERTHILMDTANKEGALVVGTGDLSELALGWCTYNGDHMSMYAVNVGVPKTLVKYLISSVALDYLNDGRDNISAVLQDICDTPISPELLPADKDGNIAQLTEDSIGKYDLHDFFLYNMLRNGFAPAKIFNLAKCAFNEVDEEKIYDTMVIFYKRFFAQQFKRSCLPDGPKVGSVAVSPRGDLRMPSDACRDLWLRDIMGDDILKGNS